MNHTQADCNRGRSCLRALRIGSAFIACAVIACHSGNAAQGAADAADAVVDMAVSLDAAWSAPAADPEIAGLVTQVSVDKILATINQLVSFGTRNTCSDDSGMGGKGIGAARDFLLAQYRAIGGLEVKAVAAAVVDRRVDPPIEPCGPGVMRENVVAWLPGKSAERLIVIGGHYDSRNSDGLDATGAAPGANDSGSQSALVLETARVLSGSQFDATLVFVAFMGEEQGLIGSAELAAHITDLFPGAVVEAMLNADIVGGDSVANTADSLKQFRLYSPGTPREVKTVHDGTPDDTSPSRGLMRFVASFGGLYVPEMAIVPHLREDRIGRGGDHESFIAQKIPGVRFIEAIESPNAGMAGSHEHTADDKVDFVQPDYTARVTRVVLSVAASLARAPSAPRSFMVGGNLSDGFTMQFTAPQSGKVDHYVVAARPVTANFPFGRLSISGDSTRAQAAASQLGVDGASAAFLSLSAVDTKGHESLSAYPEFRCDATSCVVPPAALDVTATR